jgi:hypothetical protein
MTTPMAYPLAQIIQVKQKRVEDQEKVVKEKREALRREEEKLREREADRDKAKNHYKDKLQQLRNEMDHATTTDKIQSMKVYLKVAEEKVAVEEKKVREQKAQVELAEKAVQVALEELRIKRQDVDKLLTHKKDWEREMLKELEIIEGREQDELGTVIFSSNQRKMSRNKR